MISSRIDYTGKTPSSNPGIVTLKKRLLSPAALRLIEEVIAASEKIEQGAAEMHEET